MTISKRLKPIPNGETKEEVKRPWKLNWTASEIGGKLKLTRNQVIGIVHRAGLSNHPGHSGPSGGARRQLSPSVPHQFDDEGVEEPPLPARLGRPKKVRAHSPQALETVVTVAHEPTTHDLLANVKRKTCDCQWPIGDPASAQFHFCGKTSLPGKPYCDVHTVLAYQPTTKAKANEYQEKRDKNWARTREIRRSTLNAN